MHAALLIAAVLQSQHVAWAPSIEVAKTYSQKTGKPVLIVNRAALGSGPPRVFGDKRLAELNKYFICVIAYTVEAARPVYEIPAKWRNVNIFLVEPDGKLIGRMGGLYLPWDMVDSAKQCLWARSAESLLAKRLRQYPAEGNSLAKMSMVCSVKGRLQEAEDWLNRAANEYTSPDLLRRAYITLGDQLRVEQRFGEAVNPLLRAAALARGDDQTYEARLRLAANYLRLRQFDKAESEAQACFDLKGISNEEKTISQNQLSRIRSSREQPFVK
ncbi:MAG TPA: hypothetical protein VK934_11535 [Fimbriimonas sp.]|nr:hypothetical protein [Fimbriimonas sp.]